MFFQTGTAESEGNILSEVFVSNPEFVEIINPPYASPRLLVGKKGTGKTALLRFLKGRAKEAGAPSLLLLPKDIPSFEGSEISTSEAQRLAHQAILEAVGSAIGREMSGFLTGSAKTLYEQAISSGSRDRSLIGQIGKLMSELSRDVTKINASRLLPEKSVFSASQLVDAISANLNQDKKIFYLLVDDIDQIAAPSQPNHLNRLWGFFLAVRTITQDLPFIRAIVSIRSEVWRRLIRDPAGQRDQTDHFSPLCFELSPSRSHVDNILRKRVETASLRAGGPTGYPAFDFFFDPESADMPGSVEQRAWRDLITVRSRERPRDAIQLVAALIKSAGPSAEQIHGRDLKLVLPAFSRERVKYFENEVQDEISDLEPIIRSFADLESTLKYRFRYKAEEVRDHVATIPSRMNVRLEGRVLQPGQNDVFELWSFLYRYSFLNARVKDAREPRGFRHLNSSDDDALVRKARWNDIQRYEWEINPAYRDFLLEVQEGRGAERPT